MRYARKRLDLDVPDVARGLLGCARPPERETVSVALDVSCQPSETVLLCLSVRSGFDLLLGCVGWPIGSEVLLSAVTIPHLAALVRSHGYVPVAVDVDPITMELDPASVLAASTPRSRALVFAHLFGARAPTESLVDAARSLGLMFIEDCAQCYDGTAPRLGASDVAMYSFGTIKTATCLGGGVLLVGDPTLRSAMAARQRTYPVQPSGEYAAKLVKGAAMVGLGVPAVYARFSKLLDLVAGDYDRVVRSLSRGFSDRTLLSQIRRQPNEALLAMMAWRLGSYDPSRVALRRRAGELLASALAPEVWHVGGAGHQHTHWLFPVAAGNPAALVAAGRAAGFDVTRGSSTLVALDSSCRAAAWAMENVAYLPAYAGMPPSELTALAAVVTAVDREFPLETPPSCYRP